MYLIYVLMMQARPFVRTALVNETSSAVMNSSANLQHTVHISLSLAPLWRHAPKDKWVWRACSLMHLPHLCKVPHVQYNLKQTTDHYVHTANKLLLGNHHYSYLQYLIAWQPSLQLPTVPNRLATITTAAYST